MNVSLRLINLLFFIGLLFCCTADAQEIKKQKASAEIKAKGKVITKEIKDKSRKRRSDNGNVTIMGATG